MSFPRFIFRVTVFAPVSPGVIGDPGFSVRFSEGLLLLFAILERSATPRHAPLSHSSRAMYEPGLEFSRAE
jgi:hypothetical protein